MLAEMHYIPVLRYKAAERAALMKLSPEDRNLVTPLIEIPPSLFVPRRKKQGEKLRRKPPHIIVRNAVAAMKNVWGDRRFFLDLSLLKEGYTIRGRIPWELFAEESRKRNLLVVPVTGIRQAPEDRQIVRTLAAEGGRGVCVRVKEIDLDRANFKDDLRSLLKDTRVHPRRVDLLIDFEEFYEGAPSYAEVCARIPAIDEWRSFIIASGAFTEDLTRFTKNEISPHPRADWLRWVEQSRQNGELPRKPAYSDYTVQFGRYKSPRVGGRPSASLRYALPDKWLILRGEWPGKDNGPGREQYTMWAQVLCAKSEFSGREFSAGDAYIADRAQDESRTGGPREWLFAGINHHITLTARQVAQFVAA